MLNFTSLQTFEMNKTQFQEVYGTLIESVSSTRSYESYVSDATTVIRYIWVYTSNEKMKITSFLIIEL